LIAYQFSPFSEVVLRYRGFRYSSGLAWTFVTHSAQQTVIVWPSISIVFRSSLIAQSHTGHFFVVIAELLSGKS